MPNGVSSAHALFLGNKFYCLGGYQENKPWAMNDVEHNQAPPSSGPSSFLQVIFHLNSHQQLHIKPVVIVPLGSVLF